MFKKLKLHYLGNENIKKAGVKMSFTQEQLEEIVKCSQDVFYFIEKYVKIIALDKGLIDCKLFDYQKDIISKFAKHRYNILKCSRRTGKTVSYIAFLVHYILFNDYKNILILANNAKTARGLLAKLKIAYEHLPQWLQVGVVEWNKTSIELENGTKVSADATSGSTARSGGCDILVLDEYAHVDRNVAEDFMNSVYPTITTGTQSKIIIVSTPKGMNHFYKLWEGAIEGKNNYVATEVLWWQRPGNDEAWKQDIIKNTGMEAWKQEYECDFGSIANRSLIGSDLLQEFKVLEPIQSKEGFDIHELPIPEHTYLITVDTARGTRGDCSAFIVADITQVPFKVVAKYKSNTITPIVYPTVIERIAMYYNEAYVLVEINDSGGQIADMLKHELEYENMLYTTNDKNLSAQKATFGGSNMKIGVRTTASVKNTGCGNLKALVESHKLVITDFDIISELSTFIPKGSSFAADSGCHDDLAMCLVLFSWLITQDCFKVLTNQQLRLSYKEREQERIEEEKPFMIHDDGFDDHPGMFVEDGCVWYWVDDQDLRRRQAEGVAEFQRLMDASSIPYNGRR